MKLSSQFSIPLVSRSAAHASYRVDEDTVSTSVKMYRLAIDGDERIPSIVPRYMAKTQSEIAKSRSHSTPSERQSNASKKDSLRYGRSRLSYASVNFSTC